MIADVGQPLRFRPRWTMGTMLLVVGWSAFMLWLNMTPSISDHTTHATRIDSSQFQRVIIHLDKRRWGFPWFYAEESVYPIRIETIADSNNPSEVVRPCEIHTVPAVLGNITFGILAVAVLTYVSRLLLQWAIKLSEKRLG